MLNWIKELFLSLIFQWLEHDICQHWWHQRSLEAGFDTWILQKLKQRHQYFNWKPYQPWSNAPNKKQLVGPHYFSRDCHTEEILSCFIQVLKMSFRLIMIQRGGFYPLRLLPLITEFFVFITLQSTALGNNLLEGVCLKDCKIK